PEDRAQGEAADRCRDPQPAGRRRRHRGARDGHRNRLASEAMPPAMAPIPNAQQQQHKTSGSSTAAAALPLESPWTSERPMIASTIPYTPPTKPPHRGTIWKRLEAAA